MKIVIDIDKHTEMFKKSPAYTVTYVLHKVRDAVRDSNDIHEIRRPIKGVRGERLGTVHVRPRIAGWGDLC